MLMAQSDTSYFPR